MACRVRTWLAAGVAVVLGATGCGGDRPSPVSAVRVLEVPGMRAVVNAVALSPDGTLVVVGDLDGDLVAREVTSGAERWRVRVHAPGAGRRIDGIVFSTDGALLATFGHDAHSVELWEAATGRQSALLRIERARGVAFHPTERVLVVVGGPTVYVVDHDRAEIVRMLPSAHQADRVDVVAFAPAGLVLATVSDRGGLKLWNWPELTLRASMSMSSSLEPMAPVSLALNPQGTRVAANALLGRVHVIDVPREREERTFTSVAEAPGHGMHAEMRYSLAFTDDGNWLFAPDVHDRGLRILDVAGGKAYPVLQGGGPFYKAVSIVPRASLVALLRPGNDQGGGPYALEVWRLTYGP
jgi:WD40 repeat protein